MRAFVLAAGLGTRLRPYSNLVPKPLFPILGKPILELILERLAQEGFHQIGINTHHLSEQIESFLRDFRTRYPQLEIRIFHEPEILGPVGAFLGAKEFFTEDTLVVNADILTNIPYRLLWEAHQRLQGLATMLLTKTNSEQDKVFIEGDELRGFGKASGFTYLGLQVVTPALVNLLEEGERDLIPTYQRFLNHGQKITIQVVSGFYWRDIGSPASYLAAHGDLLKGKAAIPGLEAQGPFVYPKEAPEGIIYEDWVFLPEGVALSPGSKLRRVVAWPGAQIPPGLHQDEIFVPGLSREQQPQESISGS